MQILTAVGWCLLTILSSAIGAIVGAIFGIFVGPAQMFALFKSDEKSNDSTTDTI